jgi:DNA helicase HerA-like ATPase
LICRLVNPRDQDFVQKVMENLSKDDIRLLLGFGPDQGIISGQAVKMPLIVQIKYDKKLETSAIGDEDFVTAARNWSSSPEAKAVERSDRYLNEFSEP